MPKAYAVKKVTSNKGKNTSGVDKKLWSTPASKMKAVLVLTDKHYGAKPLRSVFIKKKGWFGSKDGDTAKRLVYLLTRLSVVWITGIY